MCQRALTIIPDGYTVFLREYFGNFEGEIGVICELESLVHLDVEFGR
jgi:hypothetical protein